MTRSHIACLSLCLAAVFGWGTPAGAAAVVQPGPPRDGNEIVFYPERWKDSHTPRLKNKEGEWFHPPDQRVMYASAMLKLRRDCGGEKWLQRFFAQLATCPEIKPKDERTALRQSLNWLVAASCAARKDLSPVFRSEVDQPSRVRITHHRS